MIRVCEVCGELKDGEDLEEVDGQLICINCVNADFPFWEVDLL